VIIDYEFNEAAYLGCAPYSTHESTAYLGLFLQKSSGDGLFVFKKRQLDKQRIFIQPEIIRDEEEELLAFRLL